jgi:hypothetical protein
VQLLFGATLAAAHQVEQRTQEALDLA